MTHFGLLCPAASGHLNPMTSLGHVLRRRGHRVTLVAIPDGRERALAAGLEFAAIGAEDYPEGSTAALFARLGELSGAAAFKATIAHFQRSTTVILRDAPVRLQQLGVEALLIDQTSFGGVSIAQALGLPFISVSGALLLNPDPDVPPVNVGWRYSPRRWARLRNRLGNALLGRISRPITRIVLDYRRQHGLPELSDPADAWSPLLQICQQPAAFEYPRRRLPDGLHFTGPLTAPDSRPAVDFPWERLTGQPLIYASLGTIQNRRLGLFQTIAAACQDRDAQLVIALGGGCRPEDLPPLPGVPLVVGNAPQLQLLERAALTITHAGLNTLLESLSQAVPMVAIPIANDQPGVAARVAWSGSGAVVPVHRLSEPRLSRALDRVLQDDRYRDNARRLQMAIQQAGGVERAADLVEQAIRTGRPVRRDPAAAGV
ncbi:MAG: glycosyltransferase [Cyanobium sp.]